jgi:hypothetical protein
VHRALAGFVITTNLLQRNHAGVRSSTFDYDARKDAVEI